MNIKSYELLNSQNLIQQLMEIEHQLPNGAKSYEIELIQTGTVNGNFTCQSVNISCVNKQSMHKISDAIFDGILAITFESE